MTKTYLKKYADSFEEALSLFYSDNNESYKIVLDAMSYSLRLGGKRIRPYLLRQFYLLCGGENNSSINFEVAIESIHTYSLIHDDLPCMDDDDMRRGKPSCHKKYGEAYALLAGDGLLTEAFGIAAKTKNIDSSLVVKALSVLSELSGVKGMIGGQTIDLLSEGKTVCEEVLREICALKTGALIKSACTIGCILANASENEILAATKYAECLGLAFQIEDDILDCIGDEQKLGKPIHSDEDNNKSTFVTVFGIERCREKVARLTEEAKNALNVFGSKADNLKALADFLCNRDY